jgi:hypothetical protein
VFQREQYLAKVPKTIVELQQFRDTVVVPFQVAGEPGAATLVNLNPRVNAWFLLTLQEPGAAKALVFHLQNPYPERQTLALETASTDGIRMTMDGRTADCSLWPQGRGTILRQAQLTQLPYAPVCGDRVYLRNVVPGTYTHLERVTNFLRDRVWGGERIVGFVRGQFFQDAFRESPRGERESMTIEVPAPSAAGPLMALLGDASAARPLVPEHLGIDLGQGANGLLPGKWYPARNTSGIFVSVIQPQSLLASGTNGQRTVNDLDSVEGSALDYLVALDLAQFDLGFALGTDHPRVGWSERALNSVRNPSLPGPDGIDTVAPLVVNGMVNPITVERVAAAFAGGFKREHGAFRYGALAQQNQGTHYGFIEQGVVFSKLQPELATLIVDDRDGIQMKTWKVADEALLPHIKFARQNGVPLIDFDETIGRPVPGPLVDNWGAGNWSGSNDERFRTLRAGACLADTATSRFLIYGYFSTATPRAMARVFQAYGCRYAMHLDMNALEHTYFAIYTLSRGHIVVQHLIDGMAEVDRKGGGSDLAPRFLSFPDDRDFFYLTRKEPRP